ncbi:MAG: 4-(cytidine 5'-diphospho)-2-C-methyl-D-erythritol kinase [Ignavibacteriaceae bacterium]|jgi:4-diphosphocytidyl-2-C-methyl-D-erythritol kinase
MKNIKIKTYAKINIGLNIINKRPDGYHNIETIFYPINIFDTITFELSDAFSIESNNSQLVKEDGNSIIKAVHILEKETGNKLNVKVFLEKNIPIDAGMGGGSSDGAAALMALNNLFDLKLNQNKLKELALQIGSDAPYFINPVPSIAQSRGEVLKEIKFNIPYPVLIINPGIHISTKWAYENLIPDMPHKNISEIPELDKIDFRELKNILTNDFEKVVFPKFPEIENIKIQLYDLGAVFALMTGSGSTAYGIFPDSMTAENAKEKFPENYFRFIS